MSEESRFAELLVPEILTPVQWYAGAGREDPRFHNTKQLMLAVLVDAFRCLLTHGRNAVQRLALAETEAWIADREAQGPFAFETLCEALGMDADYLRNGLRDWRQRRLSGTYPRRQIRQLSNRRGAIKVQTKRRRASRRKTPPRR
jgi:hypothetical protein